MISNRTLAIAAVLAMSIPALGAAAPYANPVAEQLVEGHTVFAVIEVAHANQTINATAEFAAAVAVLVRESNADAVARYSRFPGVLWFNDQYLRSPSSTANAADESSYRYPCGGAVLAVNQGDPDPRVSMGPNFLGIGPVPASDAFSNDAPVGSMPPSQEANSAPYNSDYAWLNLSGTPPYSDILTGTPLAYRESYLITDPNDHMWQIDVYNAYYRVYVDGSTGGVVRSSVVWAVNLLGSPVFVPDDGSNCPPFEDLVSDVYGIAYDASGEQLPPFGPCQGPGVPYVRGACADNPPAGYKEPSGNGYCYNGNAYPPADQDDDGVEDCDAFPYGTAGPGTPCDGPCLTPSQPIRLYNALLYFKLADLTVAGAPKDHNTFGTDTNGCQVGTEWQCPANDDDAEGNSHPFRPTTPLTGEAQPCPAGFANTGSSGSNHGGSTAADYACDDIHATRQIDIYFNGDARPFPPVVPRFTIQDTRGSSEPFHYGPHGNPPPP